jgi:glutamate/tyrosine decarboxylase-like PLP-dependent enzyme/galactose mutarotase-like enzyme
LPPVETSIDKAAIAQVLEATAHRLADNYPYFHPLYAGQMLKPPHPVARAAYALAMTLNPNNHARDGGRASSEMEIEAVREIAAMFGWAESEGGFLGHLTSSGTLANLEALWIAGRLAPGRRILGSEQAHYTHKRISAVLKLEYASIPVDSQGRISLEALESELLSGDVGTVVVTLGSTATGAVDPLDEVLALRKRYGFRVHVDAAYGGYFRLIPEALDEPARRAFAAIGDADSIVIDPHKHGLQPYGCGCILFRDPAVGRFYKHDSPYTYFTSTQMHLGEISLECSRAGAAAVALWATQQLLPLTQGGEFARGLAGGRAAALDLYRRLRGDSRFQPPMAGAPELDIVVWKLDAEDCEKASKLAQRVFSACAERDLHLALVELPMAWFQPSGSQGIEAESATVTCLRSVLMKPEHEAWMGRIWERLSAACEETIGTKRMPGTNEGRVAEENVVIEAGDCAMTILPRLGGKIASIRVGFHELLQAPLTPYGPRTCDMSFDSGDASGWDECLPSVAPCTVQTEAGTASIPDHGDLWRVEWSEGRGQGTGNTEQGARGGSVTLVAECLSLPLRLERTIALKAAGQGWQLKLHYTLTNTGHSPTPWSWAAHPLFAATAGDRIVLPEFIQTLRLEGSGRNRLGNSGDRVDWPIATLAYGHKGDLRIVQPPASAIGDKLFAGPLSPEENWCALDRPGVGVRIKVSFDTAATPYLGLWICYGGWPERPGPKQMCVALEPSTAPVDSLAATGPWSLLLAPGESFSWPMVVEIESTLGLDRYA